MSTPVIPFPTDGELVHAVIDAVGTRLSISDRRILVTLPEAGIVLLDMPMEGLRRIQFDIELERPATLVIVPLHPAHHPQVLAIPPVAYEATCTALAAIGQILDKLSAGPDYERNAS